MQKKITLILSVALFAVLLVWGTYSLLSYIGTLNHAVVLLDTVGKNFVDMHCPGDTQYVCRGFFGFSSFLFLTLERLIPFVPYIILSIVLAAGYLGFMGWKTGRFEFHFTLSPWKVLLLSLGFLWLLFSTLSFMKVSADQSMRRVIEPQPYVYQNVTPEGLVNLQENFQSLQARGCLSQMGTMQFQGGTAGVYDYKTLCAQASFFTRVLPPLLLVLVFFFELLVLGRFLLSLLGVRPRSLLLEAVFSAGAGACGLIAILWSIAALHLYTMPVGWIVVAVIPLVLFKHSLYWLRQFISATWEVRRPWYSAGVLLAWFLLTYILLNFLTVVRPFPMGWDDLGSYLNRPRLMVSYGHIIYSMSLFYWEHLTSLGFLLFGYESVFGATAAMMINWTAGILAIFVTFAFVRTFLGRGSGLIAATLYYVLPLVGHFSYADMKIDNALYAVSALSAFALFCYLFKRNEDPENAERPTLRWVALAGAFAGFAFAIKSTSIMMTMALGAVMIGVLLHWVGFIGIIFLGLAALAQLRTFNITVISERIFGTATIGNLPFVLMMCIIGIACIAIGIVLHRSRLRHALVVGLFFGVALVISILPWNTRNNILHGKALYNLSIGAPNALTPFIDIHGRGDSRENGAVVRSLPPELMVDIQTPECQATGHLEELGRYWGDAKGWRHYLTLPWRTAMNLDSGGYYVMTLPVLLLFPLLLLLPFFWRPQGQWLRYLFAGTFFMLGQWMFLANGIPWYGLTMFLGLVVGIEVLVTKAPDHPNRVIASVFVIASIFIAISLRLWQFDTQRNIYEYPFGKVTAHAMQERTIPYYDDIAKVVVARWKSMPAQPYLYRMGTFIPYFIPRNLEVIATTDHQLDTFNCINHERDHQKTTARLKALGFNSIVFDTNTHTIEHDENGSLHRKVQSFIDYVNDPESGLQIVINDPGAGVAFILIP